MRAVENDFDGTRMTIPRARDATGQGDDGAVFVRVHAGRGRFRCVQARRVQTRAITVTTRASKACADAGDHGEDAYKYGVGRRGRSRSRRVQVRRGQTRAFKVKKRASKACADAVD